MNKTIHLLSEQTINQIAAGEVVENPASVVKELVENAIDAGSSAITVEIAGGGFVSIRVSDNGCGMGREDVEMSIERHATSKIGDSADLWALSTMGFRGEALASIASISHMDIVSARKGEAAVCLKVEGGKKISCQIDARAQGTSIEVKDLFYNTPARKAFQKSASASSAEITKMMIQLALAHLRVGFTLIQQKKEVFSFPQSPSLSLLDILQERASLLLQGGFVNNGKKVTFVEEECQGFAILGDSSAARQNRSGQYLFINNRPIHSLPLSFAIQEAYGTTISPHTHPLYLLHLSIPSDQIDVNVHPQKKEVRLHQEPLVRYALKRAVKKALGLAEITKEALPYTFFSPSFTPIDPPSFQPAIYEKQPQAGEQLCLRLEFVPQAIGLYKHYLLVHAESLPLAMPSGIVVFDLKRCRSRLLMEEWQNSLHPFTSQGLLVPMTLSFAVEEMEKLLLKIPFLASCGIEAMQGGKQTLLISAIPLHLPQEEIHSLLIDLLEDDKEDQQLFLSLLAKRISEASWHYTVEGGIDLVNKLFQTKDPYHCPKGRATYFLLKEADLEKRFASETAPCTSSVSALF